MEAHANAMTREQLVADFNNIEADAEALLGSTADHGGEELAQMRARAEQSPRTVNAPLADAGSAQLGKTREAGAVNARVHEFPSKAMGIAGGAGLVLGVRTGRRQYRHRWTANCPGPARA